MKRGQVAIFIIVGLFLVGAIVLFVWLKSIPKDDVEEKECSVDADCVPSECCDADLCAAKVYAPNCARVQCAPGCESFNQNILGCAQRVGGAGSCKCVNEKCAPSW